MEHPGLPGWQIKTASFDMGTKWGVAIDNGAEGAARRRHAVRIPDGTLTEAAAIERAVPVLKQWAAGQGVAA
jgi:hypothetical protein